MRFCPPCRSLLPILACTLLAFPFLSLAQEAPSARLDRSEIFLGESVRLTVSIPGASDSDQPDLSAIPDVDLAFEGSRSENRMQITIINGRMHREGFQGRHFTWRITPRRQGTLQIGPIRITIGNKSWTLEGPLLDVRPVPSQDFCTLDLTFSPSNPVPEENVLVTLSIRFRPLPTPFSDLPPWPAEKPLHLTAPFLDGPQKPGLEYPDLPALLQKIQAPPQTPAFQINQYVETVDPFGSNPFFSPSSLFDRQPARFAFDRSSSAGHPLEYRFSFPIKPLEEGDYPFGPIILKGEIIDSITPDRRAILTPLYTVLPSRLLSVRHPPADGRPLSYFGLIGSNLVADAQLETSHCRVGDPIRLILHLSGPLNWNRASALDLSRQPLLAASPFQFYPQAVQTTKRENSRIWEYLLRPKISGTLELPEIEISWFDLITRSYQTLRTTPIPIQVDPAPEWKEEIMTTASTMNESPASIPFSMQTAPAALRAPPQCPPPFHTPHWLWPLMLVGPLFRLLPGLQKLSGKLTKKAVRASRRLLAVPHARHDLGRWYRWSAPQQEKAARLCQIFRTLVADWTGESVEGRTPEDMARLLRQYGVPDEDVRQFESEMQRVFDASFNPAAAPLNDMELLHRLPPLWNRLDRQLRRSKTHGTSRLLLTFLLFLFPFPPGPHAAEGSGPSTWKEFAWEEAMSAASRAHTPEEFRAAAERFERFARETHIRNGELFYNWGLCQLLAGNRKDAWHLFSRAERYLGRPPDLARNMTLAADTDSPQLTRFLFWPHYGIPWRWRILIASLAFTLWSLLVHHSTTPRISIRTLAARIALVFFLFFAASSLLTAYQEHQDTLLLLNRP